MVQRILLALLLVLISSPALAVDTTLGGTGYTFRNHPRFSVITSYSGTTAHLTSRASGEWWNILITSAGELNGKWNSGTHTWSSYPSLGDSSFGDVARAWAIACAILYNLYPATYQEYGRIAKAILELHVDRSRYLTSSSDSTYYQDQTPWGSNQNRDYGSLHLADMALIWTLVYNENGDAFISGDSAYITKVCDYVRDVLVPMTHAHEQIVDSNPNGYSESNLSITKWIGELLWGLATHGVNDHAETLLQRKYDWWADYCGPLRDTYYPGGWGMDGSHYQIARTTYLIMWGLSALETSLNCDEWPASDWHLDFLDMGLHKMHPLVWNGIQNGRLGEYEMYGASTSYGRYIRDLLLLMYLFPTDQGAKYIHNYIRTQYVPQASGGVRPSVNVLYRHNYFLNWDTSQSDTDYTGAALSWFASGMDLLSSRTSWDEDATHVVFMAPDVPTGQESDGTTHAGDTRMGYNTGSYTVWSGEPVIIENIADASGGAYSYMPYKNTVRIGDNIIQNGWGANKTTGGVIQMDGTYKNAQEGIVYPQADITRHLSGNTYLSYAYADMDDTYWYQEVTTARRSFIHFLTDGGTSDYVVVKDYFVVTDAAHTPYHRIWFPENPTVSSPNFSIVGPNNEGNCYGTFLLPSSNLAITETDQGDNLSDYTPIGLSAGRDIWSIEAYKNPNSTTEHFMVVLAPSTGTQGAMPSTTLIDDASDNLYGVHIKDSGKNRVAIFSRNLTAIGNGADYTVTKTTSQVRHFVTDLELSTQYYVTASLAGDNLTITVYMVDPGSSTPIDSGDDGAIAFYTDGATINGESAEPTSIPVIPPGRLIVKPTDMVGQSIGSSTNPVGAIVGANQ